MYSPRNFSTGVFLMLSCIACLTASADNRRFSLDNRTTKKGEAKSKQEPDVLELRERTEEDERLEREKLVSTEQISLRTANLFAERLVWECLDSVPAIASYSGPLGFNRGARGARMLPDASNTYLNWQIIGGDAQNRIVVFTFWISVHKQTGSVVRTRVNDKTLFVNVDWVKDEMGLDEPVPELGKRSIRAILSKLNKEERALVR
jgi:hypothetical protein